MKNAKRKGTAGENELVKILESYGIRAFRNDQIFKGGKGNPDVSAEIAGIKIHIEAKRVEKLNVSAAMHQAISDAAGAVPVVIHRRNREKWLLTIQLSTLLDILKEYGLASGSGASGGGREGSGAAPPLTDPEPAAEAGKVKQWNLSGFINHGKQKRRNYQQRKKAA